jgi:hypothetical protein
MTKNSATSFRIPRLMSAKPAHSAPILSRRAVRMGSVQYASKYRYSYSPRSLTLRPSISENSYR